MVDGAHDTNATKAAEASDFRCPACGGRMEFDAARGALLCEACGAARAIGEEDAE